MLARGRELAKLKTQAAAQSRQNKPEGMQMARLHWVGEFTGGLRP